MKITETERTPKELFELAEAALRIAGIPAFNSADYDGETDCLQFVDSDLPEDACWALVPVAGDEAAFGPVAVLDQPEREPVDSETEDEQDESDTAGGKASGAQRGGAAGRGADEDDEDDEWVDDESGDGTDWMDDEWDEWTGDEDDLDDMGSMMPVATALAAELIASHLRHWLAERGWQVQFEMLKGDRRWRLADCLTFAEGGGDRLDADYPAGADELSVLCAAVVALNANSPS